jgi:hypothetical protein
VDAPRTAPSTPFVRAPAVQGALRRVLFVRAVRSSAAGYVQGLNDLLVPFLEVFLAEGACASMPRDAWRQRLEEFSEAQLAALERGSVSGEEAATVTASASSASACASAAAAAAAAGGAAPADAAAPARRVLLPSSSAHIDSSSSGAADADTHADGSSGGGSLPRRASTGSLSGLGASPALLRAFADAEADAYWCLCKLLDGIQDHYTFSQPGLQRKLHALQNLIRKVDPGLAAHLEHQGLEYLQFAFRWLNCLLQRELPPRLCARLFDTYIAEADAFPEFIIYVLAAFELHWASDIKELEFSDLIMFLQALPTEQWGESEVAEMLSRAHQLRVTYARAGAGGGGSGSAG